MASIIFACEKTHQRFVECKRYTESRGDHSLMKCIGNLINWRKDIVIGLDFDEMSFSFLEKLSDEEYRKGFQPVRGGIIYHGERDGFGSGSGPTFAVTIDKTEGYSIHT